MSNTSNTATKDARTFDLLSTADVAPMLGVTEMTVRRLVKEGRLRAWQLVPRSPLRFRAVDVAELIVAAARAHRCAKEGDEGE